MSHTAFATFGGGCFWGLEVALRAVPGVVDAVVGYAGGHIPNPTYAQVCGGRSGHVEVVRVEYDPHVVRYERVVGAFFDAHDPTTIDRQGPDVGPQYRSVVFVHDENEQRAVVRIIAALEASGMFPSPIVTRVEHAPVFHPAEEYHQSYLAKRGLAACRIPAPSY